MLEVEILKEKLRFLLIGLLLFAVRGNPCSRTVLGSKSLLVRDSKCLGWDPWEFGKV